MNIVSLALLNALIAPIANDLNVVYSVLDSMYRNSVLIFGSHEILDTVNFDALTNNATDTIHGTNILNEKYITFLFKEDKTIITVTFL